MTCESCGQPLTRGWEGDPSIPNGTRELAWCEGCEGDGGYDCPGCGEPLQFEGGLEFCGNPACSCAHDGDIHDPGDEDDGTDSWLDDEDDLDVDPDDMVQGLSL
jgi:hypothetical protein